jgi:hypothetical protein
MYSCGGDVYITCFDWRLCLGCSLWGYHGQMVTDDILGGGRLIHEVRLNALVHQLHEALLPVPMLPQTTIFLGLVLTGLRAFGGRTKLHAIYSYVFCRGRLGLHLVPKESMILKLLLAILDFKKLHVLLFLS